ncbi:uncharacterized protein LOC131168347 [Malania oleifera]|uniref:uncharacterized protein LOC131168347 n=1 Tax=Malania oleifera TaxID=397392 RepID=UPI0025ADF486|nr:uncharacterized protein LOC131168347 [Malania oleifera]
MMHSPTDFGPKFLDTFPSPPELVQGARGSSVLRCSARKSKFSTEREREMGTREVYEEKLRSGNLYHDPTMNPGLGSPRCPRCLSLLNPNTDNGEWTITPVLHGATAVAGSGIGGMLSAIYGLNTGMPHIQNYVKGPKWLPFLIGLPPLLLFSAGSAAFGGYALPKFAQLTVTSYYASSSASHYGISLLTRHIEDTHMSRTQHERLR